MKIIVNWPNILILFNINQSINFDNRLVRRAFSGRIGCWLDCWLFAIVTIARTAMGTIFLKNTLFNQWQIGQERMYKSKSSCGIFCEVSKWDWQYYNKALKFGASIVEKWDAPFFFEKWPETSKPHHTYIIERLTILHRGNFDDFFRNSGRIPFCIPLCHIPKCS